MNKIIGITGRAGVGKTTLANILRDKLLAQKMIHSEIIPFAKKLKDIAKELGWNGAKDDKGRKLLQLLGMEVARECIDNDIWIMHWDKEMRKRTLSDKFIYNSFFIIDDVRFLNEASYIKEHKGIIIKMIGRNYDNVDANHQSESELNDIEEDILIVNDGDLDVLIKLTDVIFKVLQL